MDFFNRLDQSTRSQRGSLALFAALLITVIVGFIALSVDTARFDSAIAEKRNTAGHVALAALQEYFDWKPTPTPSVSPSPTPSGTPSPTYSPTPVPSLTALQAEHYQRLISGVRRAEILGSQNKVTSRFGDTQVNLGELNMYPGASPPPSQTSVAGTIESGRWWTYVPSSCSSSGPSCPCAQPTVAPSGPALSAPCFQACNVFTGCIDPDGIYRKPFANAMRVQLSTRQGQGVMKLFGRVFGGAPDVSVSGGSTGSSNPSTAFGLPKVGVLLFDLSRSMQVDNYKPFERGYAAGGIVNNDRSEYAYELTNNPGCTAAGAPNPCGATGGSCTFVSPAFDLGSYSIDSYRQAYTKYPGSVTGGTSKNDYECFNVSVGSGNRNYLVNIHGPQPQPFTQLLDAAHEVVDQFGLQGNPADNILLMGFDNDFVRPGLLNVRTYPQNAPGSTSPFTNPSDPSFATLSALTDTRPTAMPTPAVRRIRAQNMFFPRSNSVSDIPQALREAYNLISQRVNGQWTTADPFIMLFSSGLSSCNRGSNGLGPVVCKSFRPKLAPGTIDFNDPWYAAHETSLREMATDVVQNMLLPDSVRLHVVTAGDNVKPHSVIVTDRILNNPARGCLTDGNLRRFGMFGAVGEGSAGFPTLYPQLYTAIGDAPAAAPYYQAADFLYYSAVKLQSWYMALQSTPCPMNFTYNGNSYSGAPAPNGPFAIDSLCQNETPPGTYGGRVTSTTPRDVTVDSMFGPKMVTSPASTDLSSYMDPTGRLFCDPYSRSPQLQANSFVSEIMGSRPLYLVE